MKEYVVEVDLGKEAVSIYANSEKEAIGLVRTIIEETYQSDTLAETAKYKVTQ